MNLFLAAQHTYDGIQLGLFDGQQPRKTLFCEKKKASKEIIVLIDQLLKANNVLFQDLLFIAANQGPGPFTSLRVVIASVNGLAFALEKPLIGIDGFDALFQESEALPSHDVTTPTVALLNAYSGDVYFAIRQTGQAELHKGYQNASDFLHQVKATMPKQKINFIGQAVPMHQEEIVKIFGNQALISENLLEHCSIETIGAMSWKRWEQQKNLTNQLLPLYLKTVRVVKTIPHAP